jgi:hypothetical protein
MRIVSLSCGRRADCLTIDQPGTILMNLAALKAEALEQTTRSFLEKYGYVPDQESDEWEGEYRRQFALAQARLEPLVTKARKADAPAAPRAVPQTEWPELSGPAAQARWAASLRSGRLAEIQNEEIRSWIAGSWTAAKDWIDTRELSAAAFLSRVQPRYAEHRRRLERRAAELEAERQARANAAATIAGKVKAAGISARGLMDLVDVSLRVKTAPISAKLAELHADARHLRVFETTNSAALLILESGTAGRSEYAIERDDGLVADLKLFAQTDP